MITVRKSNERGAFNHGWLDTKHTFSFSRYIDRNHMGFRSLRVINEDWVAPGQGFGEHPHADMEILTYVVDGALAHKDSTGNQETIRPGDVQRMTAGAGIEHSEFNPSTSEPVHLLQIWIHPHTRGLAPSYEQKHFDAASRRGVLKLVASPTGEDGSISINTDAKLYASLLGAGQDATLAISPKRGAWVQVVKGEITVNGAVLKDGDGAAITDEASLRISARNDSEFLVFDLA